MVFMFFAVKPAATEKLHLQKSSDGKLELLWDNPVKKLPEHCLEWEVKHIHEGLDGKTTLVHFTWYKLLLFLLRHAQLASSSKSPTVHMMNNFLQFLFSATCNVFNHCGKGLLKRNIATYKYENNDMKHRFISYEFIWTKRPFETLSCTSLTHFILSSLPLFIDFCWFDIQIAIFLCPSESEFWWFVTTLLQLKTQHEEKGSGMGLIFLEIKPARDLN